jgi:hypothetical protein
MSISLWRFKDTVYSGIPLIVWYGVLALAIVRRSGRLFPKVGC